MSRTSDLVAFALYLKKRGVDLAGLREPSNDCPKCRRSAYGMRFCAECGTEQVPNDLVLFAEEWWEMRHGEN